MESRLREFEQGHPFENSFNLQSGAYMSFFDPHDSALNYRNVAQNTNRVMFANRATHLEPSEYNFGRHMRFSVAFSGFDIACMAGILVERDAINRFFTKRRS